MRPTPRAELIARYDSSQSAAARSRPDCIRYAYCAQVTAPLVLRAGDIVAERPEGTADDIHFTEALAASVIGYASQPGDLVLDPFAGYGTTVTVAERMGRRAIGIELVPQHLEIARRRTGGGARLILGDARELSRLVDEPLYGRAGHRAPPRAWSFAT